LHGKSIRYSEKGEKVSEVEYNANVGKGYIKDIFVSGLLGQWDYEGEFLQDQPHGQGRCCYARDRT